jgi:flavodoxin
MSKKNLVLYFSVYGTAKKTAAEIAKQADADLVEIIPIERYDSNRGHYDALAAFTKLERDENRRPAIKNNIDISDYENIFIGYPIWWYTLPMIMYTLFDKYDFSGKTIIPFNTHMGSSDGGTYSTIKELEPNANVLTGLPLEMKDAERGNPKAVAKWLEKLQLD